MGNIQYQKKVASSTIENNRFKDFEILYPTKVDVKKENDLIKSYNESLNTHVSDRDKIIDKTSDFIVFLWPNVIALHDRSTEYQSEVLNYENQIQNNKFPYCIVLSHHFENEDNDTFYSLESASKLQAYKNLKVSPRIIEIKKIENNARIKLTQTLDYFYNRLYSWQSKSIFDWFSHDEKFIEKISNTDHSFRKYIKNGFVKEYWTNQKIKSQGNYVDNKAEGIVETFYSNGQLKSKELFNYGRFVRPVEGYYENGKKQYEYQLFASSAKGKMVRYLPNEMMNIETYYDNGKYSVADISDGESYVTYHLNGNVEFIGFYKNGQRYRFQKFDNTGKLIEDKNSSE